MTYVKPEDRQQALTATQFIGRRPGLQDPATVEWVEKGSGSLATPELKSRAYQLAQARERGFAEGIRASGGQLLPEEEPEFKENNPMGKFPL